MSEPDIKNLRKIGENDYGYSFVAGQLAGKWVGFAIGELEDKSKMAFILPGCDEDELPEDENFVLPDEIIKRVGAVAQSVEHGYGGVNRWFVAENLRGRPEDFRCRECGSVGCSSDHHNDYFDFD